MMTILRKLTPGGFLGKLLFLLAAAALLVLAFSFLFASRTIFDLLLENRKLKQALGNLTQEYQIGYAKVVSQETRDGRTISRIRFAETDRKDSNRVIARGEYEIEGDLIHFDALIVTFDKQLVMDGKARALYLWRRIYGDTMAPENGYPLAVSGEEPARYADVFRELPLRDRRLFWAEIWQLANEPERLKKAGVSAIYGNVVYRKMRPGLIYIFKIDNSGRVYPDTVPDF